MDMIALVSLLLFVVILPFLLLGYLIMSVVVGGVASSHGRNGFGYFLLALFISPILALWVVKTLPSHVHVDKDGKKQLVEISHMPFNFGHKVATIIVAIMVAIVVIAIWPYHSLAGLVRSSPTLTNMTDVASYEACIKLNWCRH